MGSSIVGEPPPVVGILRPFVAKGIIAATFTTS
jgi:hypothetical protein